MTTETADLIEEIDEHREEARRVLGEAEERLREADKLAGQLERNRQARRRMTEQARETLRRAGFLR